MGWFGGKRDKVEGDFRMKITISNPPFLVVTLDSDAEAAEGGRRWLFIGPDWHLDMKEVTPGDTNGMVGELMRCATTAVQKRLPSLRSGKMMLQSAVNASGESELHVSAPALYSASEWSAARGE